MGAQYMESFPGRDQLEKFVARYLNSLIYGIG